jgi:hypothetical protein
MKYSCHVYYSFVWFWCTFIWLLYDFYGLTYWPSAQCQLLFSACFWFSRKSVSNEVQMQQNFLMIFSGRKRTQEASGKQQKSHTGPTSHLGMPAPPGAPWCLVGPLWHLFAWFQRWKILYIQKPPKVKPRWVFTLPQASVPKRSHLELCSGTLPEGEIITGGHLHHPTVSMTRRE